MLMGLSSRSLSFDKCHQERGVVPWSKEQEEEEEEEKREKGARKRIVGWRYGASHVVDGGLYYQICIIKYLMHHS